MSSTRPIPTEPIGELSAATPDPEELVDPDGAEAGRFRCPDCDVWCTRGPSGREYGHLRGWRPNRERCPRRPVEVDPHYG